MNALATGLIVVLVSLLMGFLAKAARRKPPCVEGVLLLKYGPFYSGVGFACMGICLGLALLIVFGIVKTLDDMVGVYGMILLFFSLGLLLILAGLNLKVEAGEEILQSTGMLGKMRKARWEEITEIVFNRYTQVLSLKTPKTKIAAHLQMTGFLEFLEIVQRKTPLPMHQRALELVDLVRKRLGI